MLAEVPIPILAEREYLHVQARKLLENLDIQNYVKQLSVRTPERYFHRRGKIPPPGGLRILGGRIFPLANVDLYNEMAIICSEKAVFLQKGQFPLKMRLFRGNKSRTPPPRIW